MPAGPPPRVDIEQERNKIVVTQAGALLWNEQQLTQAEPQPLFSRVAAMQPQPELQFEPHAEAALPGGGGGARRH